MPTLGLLPPQKPTERMLLADILAGEHGLATYRKEVSQHGQMHFSLLGKRGNLGIRSAIAPPTASDCSEKRESSAPQPSGRRENHVLPRLGREEESSIDGEAFPELKAQLMNAPPL